ncbi:MAG TPA: tetratricopeptide repeat protein, partial [Candidatus Edwardsbacteria bacterium]|nr:tetratricopeptide repeat protein [Candidatus Edwardsbacteria bacterium]
VYHDLAWMSYRQGYLEKSRGYCEGAQLVIKSMSQKSGPAVEQARADLAHLMALIDASSGQLESALANLENERQLRLRFDDPVRMSALYNKISSVLQAMGRIKQALDFQRQTMELAQRSNDLFRQAVSHKNFGELYCSLGDLDRALDHYRRALDLSQAVDNQLGIIFANAGIGRIFAARGNRARAEQHLQDALKLARRIKNREQEGSVLIDLAELANADRRPAEAARFLEAARTLENELDQPLSPRFQISAARQYLAGNDPDGLVSARSLMEQLLAEPIVINDEEHASIPELEIEACVLLGRALQQLGRRDLAGPVLQRAADAVDAFARDLDQPDRATFLARDVVGDLRALTGG